MRSHYARKRLDAFESLEKRDLLHGNVGLTIGEVEVRENVGLVTVTVLRSGVLDDAVTVDYTTVEDSAKNDTDFGPRSGTLQFAPNEVGQQIQIRINDDQASEPTEAFRIELSNPTGGAEIDRASQIIRILDDDTGSSQIFADRFETGETWTIDPFGTDTATKGRWQVGAPQSTEWNSQTIQPGATAEGQRGLITGTARIGSAVSNDVDGGVTTAISPVISLPAVDVIDLSFNYFFAHDAGSSTDDFFRLSMVPEDTQEPITLFETLGTGEQRTGAWIPVLVDLSNYASQDIQILVTANDGGGESIVEAGLDQVSIDSFGDNPGVLSFAETLVNVEEGVGATATIEVVRTRGRTGEVTVEVVSADQGATSGEDYLPVLETLTFADDERSKTVTISILDDGLEESLENIELTLRNPAGGATLGTDSVAAIRIIDNDRFSQGLLPDLVAMEDDFETNYIDLSEQPGRALYRFGTAVANTGDGALEIWGGEASGETQEVLQRVYEPNGEFHDRLAGSFVYHAAHGHVHLEGFAEFHLRTVEDDGSVGPIAASGGKNSFCLLNISHPFPELTETSHRPHGRGGNECDTIQGISVGHADIYSAGLEGQWIDITELEDGDYYLEVVADPDGVLLETDETNNVYHAVVAVDNPYFVDGAFVSTPEVPPTMVEPIPEDVVSLEGPTELTGSITEDETAVWYRFEAAAGSAYAAEVVLPSNGESLGDSEMRLRDANGGELIYDDDGGSGLGSRIAWVAPTDGVYYWQVGSLGGFGTGNFQFVFEQLVDDHGSNSETATDIDLDRRVRGEIEFAANQDWFRFDAMEGQYYRIDANAGQLEDPRLTLFGSDGITEILSVDDRNAPGTARAYWQAEQSGTYFVRIDAGDLDDTATGSYRVRVSEVEPPADDFSNETADAVELELGVETRASIDYELDQDVFAISINEGDGYVVQVHTNPARSADIERPILKITDATGTVLQEATNNTDQGIEWIGNAQDTHYVSVRGHDGMTGDYRIVVSLEDPDETDDGLVALTLPLTRAASFHVPGDVDVFAFEASAGTPYSLSTSVGGSTDSVLTLLGPDGSTVLATNDDESDASVASRINWSPESDGRHYVSVSALDGRIGDYELMVVEGVTEPVTEPVADDHSNVAGSDADSIILYETVTGVVNYRADEDWFRYPLSSRLRYNLTLSLNDRLADDVDDSELPRVRVFDAANELLFAGSISPGEQSHTIDFLSPGTGQVYIQVTNPQKGEYDLTLETDDHGDNASNAELAVIGNAFSGNLETESDVDWFRIEPKPGVNYRIETILSGTLGDSTLRILDQDGSQLAFNDDFEGLASRLEWVPSDEPFFFEVNGFDGGTGTYRVLVTEIEDDHGNSAIGATPLELGASIAGEIQVESDVDWFSFPVVEGTAYRATSSNGFLTILNAQGTSPNGGSNVSTSFVATEDGTMYVEVGSLPGGSGYDLTVVELEDAHGDSADAATLLAAPFLPIDADLEVDSDVDWYQFSPTAGQTYRFDVDQGEFGSVSLSLFGKDGVVRTSDRSQGFFWRYEPEPNDPELPYFVRVDGTAGPYRLQLSELGATVIEVAAEQNGNLTEDNPSDWFLFEADGETIYEITLSGASSDLSLSVFQGDDLSSSQTTQPSLYIQEPTELRIWVNGPTEATYQLSVAEISPTAIDVPIDSEFTLATSGASDWFTFVPQPGLLYEASAGRNADVQFGTPTNALRVFGDNWFAVEATEVLLQVTTSRDDHDYDLEVEVHPPEQLEFDNPIASTLSRAEIEWYQFSTQAGATYRIETALRTLDDSVLELFDAAGNSLAFNDDGPDGLASRIDWEATETRQLYVQVRSFSDGAGRYSVTVSRTAAPPLDRDVNRDGQFDAADIDLLFAGIRSENPTDELVESLDWNTDGMLTTADIDSYFDEADVLRGDLNLDGTVNFSDFVALSAGFGKLGGWSQGDLSGDGEVKFEDFVALSANYGREQ